MPINFSTAARCRVALALCAVWMFSAGVGLAAEPTKANPPKAAASAKSSERGNPTERRFVIDSGTFETRPSPRSLVEFYQNYETLGAYTFDLAEKYIYRANRVGDDRHHWWSRTRRGIQTLFAPFVMPGEELINPSGYVATTGWETVHEYAHWTRGALRGIDHGFNPDFHDFGDNPYSFSVHLFRTLNETGGDVWKNAKSKTVYSPPSFLSEDEKIVISAAAGMNQQNNLARDHVKCHVLGGDRLDIANFYSYYINAASYFAYNDDLLEFLFSGGENGRRTDPIGDRGQLSARWNNLGRHFSDMTLARNNLLATALSGTTISYALGTWRYIMTGRRDAEFFRFGGFRLPDFYTYYNTNGPTLMVSSDYRLHEDRVISFAVETVTDGKSSTDIELGYDQAIDVPFGFARKVNVGGQFLFNPHTSSINGGLTAGINLYRNVSILAGYDYYNFDTLRGERDIPSLEDGKSHHEFFSRLTVTF